LTLSPNMTEKHLKAIFDALPGEMDGGELCALTLTLHSAFIETPQEIITNLISTIYTYGASQGISSEAISYSLRLTADLHDNQDDIKQTTH
jgi:hypothetical protein